MSKIKYVFINAEDGINKTIEIIFSNGEKNVRPFNEKYLEVIKEYFPLENIRYINGGEEIKNEIKPRKKYKVVKTMAGIGLGLAIVLGGKASIDKNKGQTKNIVPTTTSAQTEVTKVTTSSIATIPSKEETRIKDYSAFEAINYNKYEEIKKADTLTATLLLKNNSNANLDMFKELTKTMKIFYLNMETLSQDQLKYFESNLGIYRTPCLIVTKSGKEIAYTINPRDSKDLNGFVEQVYGESKAR